MYFARSCLVYIRNHQNVFHRSFRFINFEKKLFRRIFRFFFFSFFSVATLALFLYIINEAIILHDKNVFERFFFNETFQWKKFIVWTIKTVSKKTKNWFFHKINNIMIFSCYEKLTNQNSEMKDSSKWKNVINVIKIWLKKKKCNDENRCNVCMTQCFEKTSTFNQFNIWFKNFI